MEAAEDKEQRSLDELRRWHIGCFTSLGFNHYEAELLDIHNVDWHQAASLLADGCTHELAIRILK